MKLFYELVYMLVGHDKEESDVYEDIGDARADFAYSTREARDKYQYVILRQIETNYCDYEVITVLDEWTGQQKPDDRKTNYITIYADDFDTDVWEDYCHTANVSLDATYITIYFKDEDVKSDATTDPDEETEEE